jgi:hypothetical protein
MRRWAGLLALFLLATLGALAISARMRPSEWERRHATIRVGMTPEEVAWIMNTGGPEPLTFLSERGAGFTLEYRPPKRFLARDVRLEVFFDENARVAGTAVDGNTLRS